MVVTVNEEKRLESISSLIFYLDSLEKVLNMLHNLLPLVSQQE